MTKNELFRKTRLQVCSFKDLSSRTTPGCLLPPRNEETYPKTYLKILKNSSKLFFFYQKVAHDVQLMKFFI